MIKNIKAFTLVELIVVLTIVTILSTVWFVAYTDYLRWVRDSSRIQQMTEMHKSFVLYATRSRLPIPSSSVWVVYGSSQVWTQWYADSQVLEVIKYSDGWFDPKTKSPYTYFMSQDRKSAQLLWYFEERQVNSLLTMQSVQAEQIYDSLYPQVVWAELGVLLEQETQRPIHELLSLQGISTLDIESYTWALISYASNSSTLSWTWTSLVSVVPKLNCKKLLSVLGSAENGIYKINPTWIKQIEVYCDMEADGGWWTFAGFIDNDMVSDDISFVNSVWIYDSNRADDNIWYLLDMDELKHTEILWVYNPDISIANNSNQLIQAKYDIWFPWLYSWPVTPCTSFFDSTWNLMYRTNVNDTYSVSTREECNATTWWFRPSDNSSFIFRLRNSLDGAWIGSWAAYDSRTWGITNTSDPDYDVSWWHDVWIYVR